MSPETLMPLMYKPNPAILLADDDGTVFYAIVPRDLPLTTADLFDLRLQAEELGLRLRVVESVTVDHMGWLEDEIRCASVRLNAAATAPRSVQALLAKGVNYMNHLSIDLGIVDGLNDGLNVGEPIGCLPPEAMAQRLRFRLAYLDEQRQAPKPAQESARKARGGAVVRRLERGPEPRGAEDVRPHPVTRDGILTRAVDVANKKAVSFSALVEKYCHSAAMSDAVRVLCCEASTSSAVP